MKQLSLLVIATFFSIVSLKAQQHKIIFDLTTEDTASQSRVLRQFDNILNLNPDAELELVCHGDAVYMVEKSKAVLEPRMKSLMQKGKVSFVVCANSMKRLGIDKSRIIPIAQVVPMAVLELSAKQQLGWSYIWSH